ncbi:MAG: hypothetical protein ACREPI_09990 [Candidatus Dormibacterales bacterium]
MSSRVLGMIGLGLLIVAALMAAATPLVAGAVGTPASPARRAPEIEPGGSPGQGPAPAGPGRPRFGGDGLNYQ